MSSFMVTYPWCAARRVSHQTCFTPAALSAASAFSMFVRVLILEVVVAHRDHDVRPELRAHRVDERDDVRRRRAVGPGTAQPVDPAAGRDLEVERDPLADGRTATLSPGIASATESPINVTCWIVSARDPPAAGVLAAKAVAATSAATRTVTPRIGADGTERQFRSWRSLQRAGFSPGRALRTRACAS